jgi:hypothetical protein
VEGGGGEGRGGGRIVLTRLNTNVSRILVCTISNFFFTFTLNFEFRILSHQIFYFCENFLPF